MRIRYFVLGYVQSGVLPPFGLMGVGDTNVHVQVHVEHDLCKPALPDDHISTVPPVVSLAAQRRAESLSDSDSDPRKSWKGDRLRRYLAPRKNRLFQRRKIVGRSD